MKAKEYVDKYYESVINGNPKEMVVLLMGEIYDIANKRKVSTTKALTSCIVEINNKYLAITSIFEKRYGFPVLKRDGFMLLLRDNGLEDLIDENGKIKEVLK